jgi:hypothetical protein
LEGCFDNLHHPPGRQASAMEVAGRGVGLVIGRLFSSSSITLSPKKYFFRLSIKHVKLRKIMDVNSPENTEKKQA